MTITQEWLEAAYNRSSSNDPGKLAQDPELIAHLNRVYQRVWSLWARMRPDEAASLVNLVLVGGPPLVALPANIIDVVYVQNALLAPVHLIPLDELTKTWHIAPSVYRRGMSLVSRNLAGDPVAGDTLTLSILDAPATLVDRTTAIDARFPIRHHQLAVDSLAMYLGTKDAERPESDRAALLNELKMAAGAFAMEYNLPPGAIEWIHGPTKRQAPSAQ